MCDYSLEIYKSRMAEEGEELTLMRFGTGTQGFAPNNPGERDVAACVMPGAKLMLSHPTAPEPIIAEFTRIELPCSVTMVADGISVEATIGHRDAVKMPCGNVISLQKLPVGTLATVLPATAPTTDLEKALRLDEVAPRRLVASY